MRPSFFKRLPAGKRPTNIESAGVPANAPSQTPAQPVLMPDHLQTQTEKLREVEKAVKQQAQQLQNHKQRQMEALIKLSEQQKVAIKEAQESELNQNTAASSS